MNKYNAFLLEARGEAGGSTAPGFGAPKRENKKKPTKEQLARWRARSESDQAAYLKKFPNSIYKNAPKRGNIITRSKKISRSPTAVALTQQAADVLESWNVKGRAFGKKAAHTMVNNANAFLKGSRQKFVEKATNTFDNFKKRLSKSDQGAAEEEAEAVTKTALKPSRTFSSKKLKGVLPSLIGLAIAATVFGGLATGFIPPQAIAFIGVKALDAAWDAVRHVTSESGGLTALVAGSVIKDYLNSKDSDDDIENTKGKLEKKFGKPDTEEEDDEEEPKENKETDTTKDLGFQLDTSKYEKDDKGNWIRKKQ